MLKFAHRVRKPLVNVEQNKHLYQPNNYIQWFLKMIMN